MRLIGWIGDRSINFLMSLYDVVHFTGLCILHMFHPKSYNPAMRMVLTKQIYFTTVQIIPLFFLMATIFGSIIIGIIISLATDYNLQDRIGSIIITFVLDEFAPFFTAILIALRSGAAVNTEIAVMHVNKELNTLQMYEIDLIDYLAIPRIISGIVSVTSLSIIFTIIMLTSGYLVLLFTINMDLHTYEYILINALEVKDLIILLSKGVAFGLVIMLIPIYSGLKTDDAYTAIPISVLNGMVKLFIAIFFIEVVSLILQSI